MSFRGSIKKCVDFACTNYANRRSQIFSIIRVPAGKYFYVLDDIDSASALDEIEAGRQSILFHGTFHELRSIVLHDQLSLFGEADDPDPDQAL